MMPVQPIPSCSLPSRRRRRVPTRQQPSLAMPQQPPGVAVICAAPFVCVSLRACMCACKCKCIYICVFVYVQAYAWTCICMHACMHVCRPVPSARPTRHSSGHAHCRGAHVYVGGGLYGHQGCCSWGLSRCHCGTVNCSWPHRSSTRSTTHCTMFQKCHCPKMPLLADTAYSHRAFNG